MDVLVSGSSGLIGSAVVQALQQDGARARRLRRPTGVPSEGNVVWDPPAGRIEADGLEGLEAVVHLAGENIAAGRWTAKKKQRIRDSRVKGTALLCRALAQLNRRPRVLISASAIGYYGDRGDEVLTEDSPPGRGFLPEVCVAWEKATRPAEAAGIRVVRLRIGVVLTPKGGALNKMLPAFKMGAAGKIGSGRQWKSWVSADDLVGIIRHALADDALSGPVNAVSPEPVTNGEFTKTLGRVLGRPTVLAMPAFAARLALGQMANDLLLASARVTPGRLGRSGYPFLHTDLEAALRDLLSGR